MISAFPSPIGSPSMDKSIVRIKGRGENLSLAIGK